MTSYDIEHQEFTQSERMCGLIEAAALNTAAWCVLILIFW